MLDLTTAREELMAVAIGDLWTLLDRVEKLAPQLDASRMELLKTSTDLADKVEATCRAQTGRPVAEMLAALIESYWRAKTERAEVTRALAEGFKPAPPAGG